MIFWILGGDCPIRIRFVRDSELEKQETIQTQGSSFLFQGTSSLDTSEDILAH